MSYRKQVAQRQRAQKSTKKGNGSNRNKNNKRGSKPKKNFIVRFFGWSVKTSLQIGFVCLLLFGGLVYYYSTKIPPLGDIIDGRRGGSVTFLDRHGDVYAWRGEQFDGNLTAENASEYLVDAVVATEDRGFYHHLGVSPRGIARAMWRNYNENQNPFRGEGGSTITTQVAKLLCLGEPYDPSMGTMQEYEAECRRSTLDRKLKEIPYAMALELKFSKEEILTIYLNRAYMGAGTYGFGAAAKRYFGIPAQGLNPAQSAMLAGMLTAPSRYAPTNNLERSQDRAATVVRLMRDQGYLTQAQADEAMASPAVLSPKAQDDLGIYFADWLMKEEPDFLTTETGEDIIYYTTFDPQMQRWAESAVADIFASKVSPSSRAEAAVVVMDRTGGVRAMVGGRFDEDRIEQGFNRAVDAKRQPGSAFKPIVYAAALKAGVKPYDVFVDSQISVRMPTGGRNKFYTPSNYNNRFLGPMTVIKALEQSTNTIAVELSERSPRENVIKMAHSLGIQSPIQEGPALALGASEVSLLELTSAYAGILNGTRRVVPYGWTQMGYKSDNAVIATNTPQYGKPLLEERQAGWLIYMMNNVINHGTGTRAKISGYELAGKTGTTSNYKDAWFVGFSADFVVGVWMGYDDNTPLTDVTGGGLPAEIWRATMQPLLASGPARPLPMVVPAAPPPPKPAQPSGGNVIDQLVDGITGGGAKPKPQPAPAPAQPAKPQPKPAEPVQDVIDGLLKQLLN